MTYGEVVLIVRFLGTLRGIETVSAHICTAIMKLNSDVPKILLCVGNLRYQS